MNRYSELDKLKQAQIDALINHIASNSGETVLDNITSMITTKYGAYIFGKTVNLERAKP